MKARLIIIAGCSICILSACSGDHTSQNSKDTVINTYKVEKDTSKMDTAKINSADKSATGGAGNSSDTAKKRKSEK